MRTRNNPDYIFSNATNTNDLIYSFLFTNTTETGTTLYNSREEANFEESEEMETSMTLVLPINSSGETRETTPLPRYWRKMDSSLTVLYLDVSRIQRNFRNVNLYDSDSKECNIYGTLYKELWEWALENDAWLQNYRSINLHFLSTDDDNSFRKRLIKEVLVFDRNYDSYGEEFKEEFVYCGSCDFMNNKFSIVCEAEDCFNILSCPSCGLDDNSAVNYDSNIGWNCNNCASYCDGCDSSYFGEFCENCSFYCEGCGSSCSNEQETEISISPNILFASEGEDEASSYFTRCIECAENICRSCGNFQEELTLNEEFNSLVCQNCIIRSNNQENFEDDVEEVTNLPTIPGREMIRLCGVEIEGANGINMREHDSGNLIARQLFKEKLSEYDHIMRWDSDGNGSFVYVKHDGTVDWEMVVGPINMANNSEVNILNRSVKVVREAIKEKEARLDLRCGLHIHVGAEKVGLSQSYNLHIMFSYLEDVLYRLGAAKWPVHRAILNGDRYCKKANKQNSKMDFANMYKQDKYYGLSFSNYFEGMLNNCTCGARVYGTWDECSCNLGKCTFEFRFFNSTANTTKLHAYLAITQALVAKAIDMEEIKNDSDYSSLSFIEKSIENMTDNERQLLYNDWRPRLKFIANKLPLTEKEKDSIYYCIMNSELEPVGSAFLEEREV